MLWHTGCYWHGFVRSLCCCGKCQMHPIMFPIQLQPQSSHRSRYSTDKRPKLDFDLVFIPITSLFDPIQSHQLLANPDLGMDSPKALLWVSGVTLQHHSEQYFFLKSSDHTLGLILKPAISEQ